MGVVDVLVDTINKAYTDLSISLSLNAFLAIKFFIFAISIVIITLIILKFYTALSKKNFIKLNLRKYNYSQHPGAKKFFAVLFYFIEYILIMPALILLWFLVLSIILLLLASARTMIQLLTLSGALIVAVRILAYHDEESSKELAKLIPLVALSIFLLDPEVFEPSTFLIKLKELPSLLNNIAFFLLIIFALEIVFRFIYTLTELSRGKEEVGDEKED